MIPNLMWDTKVPKKPGWYLYREHKKAPVEIVHYWHVRGPGSGLMYGSSELWPAAYGYARPSQTGTPLLLAKRMHTAANEVEDGIGGLYACDPATRQPFALELENLATAIAAVVASPPAKKKRARKKAGAQTGLDPADLKTPLEAVEESDAEAQ